MSVTKAKTHLTMTVIIAVKKQIKNRVSNCIERKQIPCKEEQTERPKNTDLQSLAFHPHPHSDRALACRCLGGHRKASNKRTYSPPSSTVYSTLHHYTCESLSLGDSVIPPIFNVKIRPFFPLSCLGPFVLEKDATHHYSMR